MKIDLLKPLVPKEYKFMQKVLDTMFEIAKANPTPTCHQEELVKTTKARKEKIETVILYLIRNNYAKHVGDDGEPIYALTGKGQSASIDREFLHTGRNERNKTVLAYGALLGLFSTILAIVIAIKTTLHIAPKVEDLEKRIESIEQRISEQSKATTEGTAIHSNENLQPSTKSDSVSLSRDSAMIRTTINKKAVD